MMIGYAISVSCLGKHRLDWFCVLSCQRNGTRTDVVVLFVIDSQSLIDGGKQLGCANFSVFDVLTIRIGRSINGSALDASSRQ